MADISRKMRQVDIDILNNQGHAVSGDSAEIWEEGDLEISVVDWGTAPKTLKVIIRIGDGYTEVRYPNGIPVRVHDELGRSPVSFPSPLT